MSKARFAFVAAQPYYVQLFVTRPNEFGSMTARKDHIKVRYVAIKGLYKTIKRPYNTIKDHTRQCKAIQYHKRPYQIKMGR